MKTYITFGQVHAHKVNGKTFDKDCVAVIEAESAEDGRNLAVEYFGPKFCFSFYEDQFDHDSMHYFPRGFIPVNQNG